MPMSDIKLFNIQGSGDLELQIYFLEDLEQAKPLIQRSFEEN